MSDWAIEWALWIAGTLAMGIVGGLLTPLIQTRIAKVWDSYRKNRVEKILTAYKIMILENVSGGLVFNAIHKLTIFLSSAVALVVSTTIYTVFYNEQMKMGGANEGGPTIRHVVFLSIFGALSVASSYTYTLALMRLIEVVRFGRNPHKAIRGAIDRLKRLDPHFDANEFESFLSGRSGNVQQLR